MRTRLLAVLLLAGAAVAVFTLSLTPSPKPPTPPTAEEPDAQDRTVAKSDDSDPPRASDGSPEEVGEIRGRVLRNGKPSLASVEIWRIYASEFEGPLEPRQLANDTRALARAESAGDGTFAFEDVPCQLFEVRATAKDGRCRSAYGGPDPWDPVFRAEIELESDARPTHELRGVAVWSDGTPFRGHISCYRENDPYDPPIDTRARFTDEAGRFVIRDLAPGEVVLHARATDRFLRFGPSVTIPNEGEYRHVVDAGIPYVEGRVVDAVDGKPVAGAEVDTTGWRKPTTGDGLCISRTTTGEDGGFRVPWFEQSVEITVRADGYVPREEWYQEKPDPFVIRIGRPLTVSGRVVSRAGPAVPGVPVIWTPVSGSVRGGTVVSDEDGAFQLEGVPPGPLLTYALGNGWVQRELVDIAGQDGFQGEPLDPLTRVIAAHDPEPLRLEVVKSAAVRGRVLAVDGNPAPGVPVQAWPENNFGRLPRCLLWPETVTNDAGEFEVAELLPGLRYHFDAMPEDGALTPARAFAAKPGEKVELEIRLVPGQWLDVTVAAAKTGEPIEGAEIAMENRGGDIPRAGGPFTSGRPIPGSWTTNKDGLARVGPLPPGPWGLRVRAEGYRIPQLWGGFEIAEGESKFRVELTRDLEITGKVLLPNGSPAAGTWLEIQGPPSLRIMGWKHRLGEDGAFRLENLPPGTFKLEATCEFDGRTFTGNQDIEAGTEDAEIRLTESSGAVEGAIVVRLRDRAGKKVFAARANLLVGRGGRYAEFFQGRLVIPLEGVAGPIHLEAYGPSSDVGMGVLPLGAARLGPLDPKPGVHDLVLPPERTIAGTVVDDRGKGVAGVRVRALARPLGDQKAGVVHADAVTDVSGAFRLRQLADETYRLEFATTGEYAPPDPVEASAGAEALKVVATRGVTVVITVVNEAGAPVKGAAVSVRSGDQPTYLVAAVREGTTDESGKVRLTGLDPNVTYRLVVHVETKPNCFEQAAERTSWSPEDTTIQITVK